MSESDYVYVVKKSLIPYSVGLVCAFGRRSLCVWNLLFYFDSQISVSLAIFHIIFLVSASQSYLVFTFSIYYFYFKILAVSWNADL